MKTQNKKERILNATLKLITEHGFHATPVSMIANEAGVGAGTIYRYFESKEAIINELYDTIMKELHEATMSNIPENISVRDEFYLKWKNILNFFINREYEGKFISQYVASPFISRTVLEETDRRNVHLRLLIERGIRQKEIRDVDYNTIAVYMWGTVKQLHHLHINKAIKLTDELIDDIYAVFWEGIRVHDD
ncbi:MAG TPA: TetR/AcrR family transcriptional regulator [Spirochaetota bacterium]|nr:TetR/AcrR family transcriptional regulator [Spirochaetota bacterium]